MSVFREGFRFLSYFTFGPFKNSIFLISIYVCKPPSSLMNKLLLISVPNVEGFLKSMSTVRNDLLVKCSGARGRVRVRARVRGLPAGGEVEGGAEHLPGQGPRPAPVRLDPRRPVLVQGTHHSILSQY